MFFFQEGFTYRNFLMDVLGIFIFVVWFWLLITVFADLFRRHDISGWIKAIWVIALIVVPYLAILAYLIFQSRGMAERNVQQAQQARDELRRVVGFSAADEIEKLERLKKAGSISDAEFTRLRAPRFDLGLILNCGVALFVPCDWAIRGDSLLVKSPRRVEGPPF
jgi:hypothetical protein